MDLGIGSFRDLPGVTVLKFMEDGSDLVKYHRDYLPDGNIVERQPVVGNLVKFQRDVFEMHGFERRLRWPVRRTG